MATALAIAMLADGIQILLGPFGWAFGDQVIDVIAMVLVSLTIGFHPLFLPTFVAEFVPGVGMLPTWTGCVLLVIAQLWHRRNRTPTVPSTPPPVPPRSDVIDV